MVFRRGQFSDHYCSLFYVTSLASLLKYHVMAYYLYADDTQLLQEPILSDKTTPEIAIRKMELCVASIRQWIKTNMLKLNGDKIEILIIHPKSAYQHLHVTHISRTVYYHLLSIERIRCYLEQGQTKQLVHVLVISRIDCSNSLLDVLSMVVVEKLQRVQNALCSYYTDSIEMRPCHAYGLGAALASC